MAARPTRALGTIALGLLVLWSGWSNFHMLIPVGKACLATTNRGLRLDSLGRIVYADTKCTLPPYEHAYLVFLLLSIIGIALLWRGGRQLRATPSPPTG